MAILSFGSILSTVNITPCHLMFFCYNGRNLSPFLKGVLWAAKTAKMGFR
jgi:hypothetical protein